MPMLELGPSLEIRVLENRFHGRKWRAEVERAAKRFGVWMYFTDEEREIELWGEPPAFKNEVDDKFDRADLVIKFAHGPYKRDEELEGWLDELRAFHLARKRFRVARSILRLSIRADILAGLPETETLKDLWELVNRKLDDLDDPTFEDTRKIQIDSDRGRVEYLDFPDGVLYVQEIERLYMWSSVPKTFGGDRHTVALQFQLLRGLDKASQFKPFVEQAWVWTYSQRMTFDELKARFLRWDSAVRSGKRPDLDESFFPPFETTEEGDRESSCDSDTN